MIDTGFEPIRPSDQPGGESVRPVAPGNAPARSASPAIDAGGAYQAAPEIRSQDYGFDTLRDFVRYGDQLTQEHQKADQFLTNYQKKVEQFEREQREIAQQYARKKEETRRAIARMNQAPTGEPGDPVASRRPGAQPDPQPETRNAERAPAQMPNFSGFQIPNLAQNAEAPSPYPVNRVPASQPVKNEALPALENQLELGRHIESEREVPEGSTIATKEGREEEGAEPASVKISVASLNGASRGKGADGKKSLREALKEALKRKSAHESGSQSATRALLAEAEKATDAPKAAEANDGAGGNLTYATGSGVAGGGGFSTSNFGQQDLKNGAFSLSGDGASAQAMRLRGELAEEKSAPEVLGRESQDLFERVRVAHLRSQKDGRVTLVRR